VKSSDKVVRPRTSDDSGLVATGNAEPRLSWSLASDRTGVLQRAYEIQVAADPAFTEPVSSGEVPSEVVSDHPWPAEPLRSREVRFWRVRVRTDLGWTAWSEPARVEAALLAETDWTARPVHVPSDRGRTVAGPVPLVRREFELPSAPVSARLYVTALGVHRTAVNGWPVSDELLEPGWTSYANRLLYATYDVTRLLAQGPNAISAMIGDGWYRGNLTWHKSRNVYGDTSALLAQLEVTLADGSTITVGTDEHWRGGYGDLRAADLYDGCERDLRRRPSGSRPASTIRHGNRSAPCRYPRDSRSEPIHQCACLTSSNRNRGHCPTGRSRSTRARTSPAGYACGSPARKAARSPSGTPKCSTPTVA
jgi:alpha-L-rhamnosidase